MEIIWITWEYHRRTYGITSELEDVKLYTLVTDKRYIIRYLILIAHTISVLRKERPKLVIVQNPSMILSLFMVTIGRIFAPCIIVDAHNGGVRPFNSKNKWLEPIFCFIHRYADLTVVTNEALAKVISYNGGRPIILQDNLPEFEGITKIPLKGEFNIVSICTFEDDEPYQEVIRAAGLLDSDTFVYITGRFQKINQEIINKASENVIFTGFLPDQQYVNLLASSNTVLDLTMEPDCLVCGAYEAVALGKPAILSDDPSPRNYFTRGVVYTENNAESISNAIQFMICHEAEMKNEVIELKDELQKTWKHNLSNFISMMNLTIQNRAK